MQQRRCVAARLACCVSKPTQGTRVLTTSLLPACPQTYDTEGRFVPQKFEEVRHMYTADASRLWWTAWAGVPAHHVLCTWVPLGWQFMFSFGSSCGSSRGSGQLEHFEGSTPATVHPLTSPLCLSCVIFHTFPHQIFSKYDKEGKNALSWRNIQELVYGQSEPGGGGGMAKVLSAVGRFDACVEPCLWADWALLTT